jgi:hypothetical protein
MPQDPDTLIPDQSKFDRARRQRQQVHQMFENRKQPGPTCDPTRLEGDELVAWIRSGMAIEQAVDRHEAIGLAALQQRGLTVGEWQIDPDGHILPREQPSSSGTTPLPATAESRQPLDH